MITIRNFINGKFVDTAHPKYFFCSSPVTAEILSRVDIADESIVKHAIDSAVCAQFHWGATNYARRADLLFDIANNLLAQKDILIDLLRLETGRSLEACDSEILAAVRQFRYQASASTDHMGTLLNSSLIDRTVIVDHVPVGVVASIIPANTPAANVAWKVAPALIHGNSIILKAPEEVPIFTNEMIRIFVDSGVPPGVINCIHGPGDVTGHALVSSKSIDLISFTGSTKTGQKINEVAAANLTKISLELGGKNPFIVMSDSDINLAVQMVLDSAYSNAGQRCSAASLLFIQEDIYANFMNKFAESATTYMSSNGLKHIVGPLMKRSQVLKIKKTVDEAIELGVAKLVFGGTLVEHEPFNQGNYYLPTALEIIDDESESALLNDELFGPVLAVKKFKSKESLVQKLNNIGYGLTCAVHTKDINNIKFFKANLRYGVINFNGKTFGSEPHFPFGGFRGSGNGTREPGFNAVSLYTEQRNISF